MQRQFPKGFIMQSAPGGGRDPHDGEADYSDIKRRLDSLDKELKKTAKSETGPAVDNEARGKAMGIAFRIATELVVGVFVGGALGWLLDRLFGTAPILLIVFLLLGIAAGLLNSVRAAQRMQKDL
jgi:ATP synthase protein I